MEKQNEEDEVKDQTEEHLDFWERVKKKDFEFIPGGVHAYTQRGPYLICKSCDLEHAMFIGMDVIMVGVSEDGKPILKKR